MAVVGYETARFGKCVFVDDVSELSGKLKQAGVLRCRRRYPFDIWLLCLSVCYSTAFKRLTWAYGVCPLYIGELEKRKHDL